MKKSEKIVTGFSITLVVQKRIDDGKVSVYINCNIKNSLRN